MWRKKKLSHSDSNASKHPFIRQKSEKKNAPSVSLARAIACELIESGKKLN
ncbi:hypothetical protein [Sphingobacterium chungjuense]|uniref:hypothetical protein n=1 Tax=Sphingobacterium chungjuense TaxID=2675553 RepID=UPI0014089F99|nr:hypothetical protein [Sphingobacterium chungjuense]